MFTLLKALTPIRLAERVEEHGVPAVAVFWIEAEDHDWDEVRSCGPGRRPECPPCGAWRSARRSSHAVARAAGRLGTPQPRAIRRCRTEFFADPSSRFGRPIRVAGMADAFGMWLEIHSGAHAGLVVYDASDPAAKRWRRLSVRAGARAAGERTRAWLAGRSALVARGYHAQAGAAGEPVAASCFGASTGCARQVLTSDATNRGHDRVRTTSGGVQSQRAAPTARAGHVVSDGLLRRGTERARLSRPARGVYEAFGLPMPLIYQRATATVVDANTMKFLTRHEFPLEALRPRTKRRSMNCWNRSSRPAVATSMDEAARAVEERVETTGPNRGR